MTKKELKELIYECIDIRENNVETSTITIDEDTMLDINMNLLSLDECYNLVLEESKGLIFEDFDIVTEGLDIKTIKDKIVSAGKWLINKIIGFIKWIKEKVLEFIYTIKMKRELKKLGKELEKELRDIFAGKYDDNDIIESAKINEAALNIEILDNFLNEKCIIYKLKDICDFINDFSGIVDSFKNGSDVESYNTKLINLADKYHIHTKGEVFTAPGQLVSRSEFLEKEYDNLASDKLDRYKAYIEKINNKAKNLEKDVKSVLEYAAKESDDIKEYNELKNKLTLSTWKYKMYFGIVSMFNKALQTNESAKQKCDLFYLKYKKGA